MPRSNLVRRHDGPLPARGAGLRARGRASAEPSAPSPSGVFRPAALATSARSPARRLRASRTASVAPTGSDACDEPCMDAAWVCPRSLSSHTHPEPTPGPLPSALCNSDRKADNATTSTWARGSPRIDAHATRSNIHTGTSRREHGTSPSRVHRARTTPPFSTTSSIRTGLPNHGCHGYRIWRTPVLWAVRISVLQSQASHQGRRMNGRTPCQAFQDGLPGAGKTKTTTQQEERKAA